MKTLRLILWLMVFVLGGTASADVALGTGTSAQTAVPARHSGLSASVSRGNADPIPTVFKHSGAQDLSTKDLTTDLTVFDVVNTLAGASAITISNVEYNGSPEALGTFTGGTGIIGFDSGIVLSTGAVGYVIGPNQYANISRDHGRPGDDDLNGLIPGLQTNDAAVLEFDFTCSNTQSIAFEYVFGSEEYNEFVDSNYNDVFGFFVNGVNIALLPDKVTPVSINTVNGGNPLGRHATNPAYYRNNDCADTACLINTEMDGLTVVLVAATTIQPGTNHIKLAIADATDDIYDSDVFIRARSLICGEITNTAPVCRLDPPGPFTVNAHRPITFTVHATDADTGNTITLGILGSLPSGATMTPPLPLTGEYAGVSSTFNWTPSQEGAAAAAFVVTDNRGRSDTCTAEIIVREGVPPRIVGADPPNGALDVAWDRPVFLTFSESIVAALIDSSLQVASVRRGHLPVTTSLLANAPTLRINASWPPNDEIRIRLTTKLTDLAGNGLDGNGNGTAEGSPTDDYVYTMTTAPGVRPGDANDDGTVDERDVLPLARHWLRTGPRRQHSAVVWGLEPATAWSPRDATYADCDGNGTIDSLDICPIADFFGRVAAAKVASGTATAVELIAFDDELIRALSNALLNCPTTTEAQRTRLQRWLESQGGAPAAVPGGFRLDQNRPNPFNAGTIIHYQLDEDGGILLDVFDVLGRPVRTLIDGHQPAGVYEVAWDGTDGRGNTLASGVYFYRLRSGDQVVTRRLVLLR